MRPVRLVGGPRWAFRYVEACTCRCGHSPETQEGCKACGQRKVEVLGTGGPSVTVPSLLRGGLAVEGGGGAAQREVGAIASAQ